ncbi:hypothetical protein RF11_07336 [Thelohanellus kitauei]|uniref:Uncharacterized protein n=1 Tax=Thelohanellus kitauei TaxID=669202 RepID=A0A0C2IQH7_THEKT|nr:hypothetical protein RF11_07336 [Thelohanellus kitauei]
MVIVIDNQQKSSFLKIKDSKPETIFEFWCTSSLPVIVNSCHVLYVPICFKKGPIIPEVMLVPKDQTSHSQICGVRSLWDRYSLEGIGERPFYESSNVILNMHGAMIN